MKLFHYLEKGEPPLLTLSDLPAEQAIKTQNALKTGENVYARRDWDGNYLKYRAIVESRARAAFIEKGGKPERLSPLYCFLGISHEKLGEDYKEWYKNPARIEIPMDEIDPLTVSFTYGDSFVANHPEHHDQSKYSDRVLTYPEILSKIESQGWPQDSLTPDSPFWLPRYIEARLWLTPSPPYKIIDC